MILLEPLIANPLCSLVGNNVIADHLLRCNLEARNTTALLTFVREGLGSTIFPESAATICPPGVAFSPPDDPVSLRAIQLIRNEERRLSPVAEGFWQTLRRVA